MYKRLIAFLILVMAFTANVFAVEPVINIAADAQSADCTYNVLTTPSDPSFRTVRLRANWKPNEYNVIYNPGDHAADGVVSQTDVKGATFDKSYDIWSQDDAEIYADSGYEFDGWNCSGTYQDNTVRNLIIDADNSNNNIDKYNFITDLTCTAQWECAVGYDWNDNNTECVKGNYKIYYKYVDDTGVEQDINDWQGITERKHPAGYNANDDEFTIDWPVRSGYVFKGWCNGTSTCQRPDYDITINPKQMREDITLYAQWGPTDCDENEEFITNPLDDITATPVNWYVVELNGAESRDSVWNMQSTPVLGNGEWIVGYDNGSSVRGVAECRNNVISTTGRTDSCFCHVNAYIAPLQRQPQYVPMTSPVEVMLPANSRCETSCASRCAETVRSGKAQSMFAGDDGCYPEAYQVNFDCGSGTPNVGGPADPDSDELWLFTLASYGQNYQFYPTDKICSCPENTEFKEWSCRDRSGNVDTYEAMGTISPYLYTSDLTCTAVCKETKITLDKNATKGGVIDGSPTELFTKFGIGAYLESSQTNLMSRTDHSLTTLPTGKLVNITFNANLPTGSTDVQNMPDDVSENLGFDGFYQNETIEEGVDEPLIDEEGFITNEGTVAAAALEEDDTWYAQWKCVRANIDTPRLEGYQFIGWSENDEMLGVLRSVTRCDSTELKANWRAYTGNLVYTCGSGNGTAPANQQLEFNQDITIASTPNTCTKNGNHFAGWSCSYDIARGISGNTTYAATQGDNDVWTVVKTVVDKIDENNVTVRCDALWEPNEYTITYKYVFDTEEPKPENGLSGLTPTTYSYGVAVNLPTKDDVNSVVNAFGYEVVDSNDWGWYTARNAVTGELTNDIHTIPNTYYGDKELYVKVKRLTCPDGYNSDGQPVVSKEEQCYKRCPQMPGATLNGDGRVYWPNDVDADNCQYTATPYTITYMYVLGNSDPVTIYDLGPTGYTTGPVNLPTKAQTNEALTGTGFKVINGNDWGWYTARNTTTGELTNDIHTIPNTYSGDKVLYVKVDLLRCPDGWNDGGKNRITDITEDCFKECPLAQSGYTLSNPDGRVYYSAELADLADEVIYAEQCEYVPNNWKIRYDCDNDIDVEPNDVEYNKPWTLKDGNEECGTKEHYTFGGWDCDNLNGVAGEHYPVNNDTQCNAIWTPIEYNVDYYCVYPANAVHQDKFDITQTYDITDENYECSEFGKNFVGWNCSYTASDNESYSVQDNDNVVPYTVTCLPDYENTSYTITYKVDGEPKVHNDLNPTGYTIADNVTLPTGLPQELLKEGHVFKEWKDEADNRVVAGWNAGDETENKVFYVAWDCAENYVMNNNVCEKQKFTVTYNSGEHGTGGTGEEVEHGSIYTLLSDSEANIVADTGYEFDAWDCETETQNDITISNNQITMPTENVICTAIWKCAGGYKLENNTCVPDEYTITYMDKTTPIDDLQPSKYRYGVGATLPTTPNVTHDSYRFVEWCTGYDAETDEYSGCGQTAVSTTDTGGKVFYARWEFVCESGKWWHIDNEKVCLYANKGNSAAVSMALDSGVHYLLIKEQEDLVIHKGSKKKFRIQRGNKVYNAYDKSMLTW